MQIRAGRMSVQPPISMAEILSISFVNLSADLLPQLFGNDAQFGGIDSKPFGLGPFPRCFFPTTINGLRLIPYQNPSIEFAPQDFPDTTGCPA